MLFNTLVEYDQGTNIVPGLAETWTTSPDGRHLGFRLRHDVVFGTGRPFTAADVKFSLERLLKPSIHSQGAEFFHGLEGATDYIAGAASSTWPTSPRRNTTASWPTRATVRSSSAAPRSGRTTWGSTVRWHRSTASRSARQ